MRNSQTLVGLDIDLFAHIYVEIFYNMVKGFKMHRFALEFGRLLIRLIVKENKY